MEVRVDPNDPDWRRTATIRRRLVEMGPDRRNALFERYGWEAIFSGQAPLDEEPGPGKSPTDVPSHLRRE